MALLHLLGGISSLYGGLAFKWCQTKAGECSSMSLVLGMPFCGHVFEGHAISCHFTWTCLVEWHAIPCNIMGMPCSRHILSWACLVMGAPCHVHALPWACLVVGIPLRGHALLWMCCVVGIPCCWNTLRGHALSWECLVLVCLVVDMPCRWYALLWASFIVCMPCHGNASSLACLVMGMP